MAKALADDLRLNPKADTHGCVGVPEIMEGCLWHQGEVQTVAFFVYLTDQAEDGVGVLETASVLKQDYDTLQKIYEMTTTAMAKRTGVEWSGVQEGTKDDVQIHSLRSKSDADLINNSYPSSIIKVNEYHTPAQVADIESYLGSVDNRILNAANQYKTNKNLPYSRISVADVSGREATDILKLTGQDYTGYKHDVDSNFFNHVEKRHGEFGEANTTMADLNDVSRVGWILKNYDEISLGNGDASYGYLDINKEPMKKIIYKKHLDGTVYVVEAVGENKWKKLHLITAYIDEKNSANSSSQSSAGIRMTNAVNGPSLNAQSAFASPATNNIAQKATSDNSAYYEEGNGDASRYSIKITDSEKLDELDEAVKSGKVYITYKSMSFWGYDEEGNAILRSPMAEIVDGKLTDAYLIPKDKSKLNWYQATEDPSQLLVKYRKPGNKSDSYVLASERPDLVAEDWSNLYFKLQRKDADTGKKQDVYARYNPYEHSSDVVLNDQFKGAYNRSNLVTVKMLVPMSEDNGTYRAQYSKDATGWTEWKSGDVAAKIQAQKDFRRNVFLSRYAAPVEIVSDAEVAQKYKEYLSGTDIAVPDNVVSPSLRKELEKAGVPIEIERSGKVKYSIKDSDGNSLTDAVQVTGFYNRTPRVRFMYRVNKTINMAAEKTTEKALQQAAERTAEELGFELSDFTVYPDALATPSQYVFLIQPPMPVSGIDEEVLADTLERRPREANPVYGACIDEDKNLQKAKAFWLQPESTFLWRDVQIAKGRSADQLKPLRIIRNEDQKKSFYILQER